MSGKVIELRPGGNGPQGLKECHLCKRQIVGQADPLRSELPQHLHLPENERPTIGQAHPVCVREAVIRDLQSQLTQLQSVAAAILEAAGGSVCVTLEHTQAVDARPTGPGFHLLRQPDGSFKVEFPSATVNPNATEYLRRPREKP